MLEYGSRMEREREKSRLAVPSRRCRSSQYNNCLKWLCLCAISSSAQTPSPASAHQETCPWTSVGDKTHTPGLFVHVHMRILPMHTPACSWHLYFNTELCACGAMHTSLVTFSALPLNTFFPSFCAETLHFISLILLHKCRETRSPSLSNCKRLESQVRGEKQFRGQMLT